MDGGYSFRQRHLLHIPDCFFPLEICQRIIIVSTGNLVSILVQPSIGFSILTQAQSFLCSGQTDFIISFLVDKGIIVRNRSKVTLCGNSLRVTIGTKIENNALLEALRNHTSGH